MLQVTFFPRTLYQPHASQRSSDDEEHGERSPPLEVSDEECLRDRVQYVTPGELGKESDSLLKGLNTNELFWPGRGRHLLTY